jgi:hypothetical protein
MKRLCHSEAYQIMPKGTVMTAAPTGAHSAGASVHIE